MLVAPILNRILRINSHYVADVFKIIHLNKKTIDLILQFHILEKIYISSYKNMSNSDNYNNYNINNLVNNDLFNLILISKHILINILYSITYIFPIFINKIYIY